jgi:hypothetical protein
LNTGGAATCIADYFALVARCIGKSKGFYGKGFLLHESTIQVVRFNRIGNDDLAFVKRLWWREQLIANKYSEHEQDTEHLDKDRAAGA